MIDLHSHILWGLDDGPKRPKDMHAMLLEARAQGIRHIAATPHVNPGFEPFDIGLYRQRLLEAQDYCDRKSLPLVLSEGAEIAWTYNAVEALRRRQIPTLNGSDCVLIELWETVGWNDVESAVRKLLRAGFMPILAHVERYWCFRLQPGRAIALKNELDVGYQVNASTILAPDGFLQKRMVNRLLEAEALDVVASDAHNCAERRNCLGEAYQALKARCGAAYAHALVNYDGVLK